MRYLVAIPVFNEASTLTNVLAEVRRYATDILVVNDGSTDDTRRLLATEPYVQTIHHNHNRGYGASLIDAFAYAQTKNYDWIITMDCDRQHEADQIPDFLHVAGKNKVDIISGSRYLHPEKGDSMPPADRQAINQRITNLLNELLDLYITDAFCGFKAYRIASLASLRLTVPGYGMPLQLWVQAMRAGLHIAEIPVRLIYNDVKRTFGETMDDPDTRMLYYYDVLVHELAQSANEPRPLVDEIRPTGVPTSY